MNDQDLLFMTGFDQCIAGVVERIGQEPIICYDLDKVIAQLESEGMSNEEAWEWHYFNQAGSWVGDRTPCFITQYQPKK